MRDFFFGVLLVRRTSLFSKSERATLALASVADGILSLLLLASDYTSGLHLWAAQMVIKRAFARMVRGTNPVG